MYQLNLSYFTLLNLLYSTLSNSMYISYKGLNGLILSPVVLATPSFYFFKYIEVISTKIYLCNLFIFIFSPVTHLIIFYASNSLRNKR